MTSKERMLLAMRNKKPDMVPVAPDISNMIPCKLTGKPFWDIYLYDNPPLWKAYIDAVRHFGFDGWLPDVLAYGGDVSEYKVETVIVHKAEDRIITRQYTEKDDGSDGKKEWSELITVYYPDNPPTTLKAATIGLAGPPKNWRPIEGAKPQKKGMDLLKKVKESMGSNGVVGVYVHPPQLGSPELPGYSIYDYQDRYCEVKEWSERAEEAVVRKLEDILSAPVKPDFILTGGSGMLIFNTPKVLRDISLPALQKVTKMCREAGIPSQIHCCGPERALIEMCANETELTSINPLEIPPMGDCDLKKVKESFGKKLSLMGNLHTTKVMLKGSVRDVEETAKRAIDDAAEGGGFILSTGDQCGRDTPEKNIFQLIEVARNYGIY